MNNNILIELVFVCFSFRNLESNNSNFDFERKVRERWVGINQIL